MCEERKKIARFYDERCKEGRVEPLICPSHNASSHHLYVIKLNRHCNFKRIEKVVQIHRKTINFHSFEKHLIQGIFMFQNEF